MSASVFQLIARLRTANRLVLVLLVIGAGMLAYDAWLGLRYREGLGRGTAALAEAKALLASARGPSGDVAALEQQLAPSEALLDSRSAVFTYEHTDELFELVATAARDAGVVLSSLNVGGGGRRTVGPLSYRVLSLSLRVSGGAERLYDFVDELSEAAPGVTVRSARLGNLSGAPWAAFEIEIPLDPAPTEGEGKTP